MARPKPQYHFELRKQRAGDGTVYYSFVLAGKHLAVRPSLNGTVLRVADIERSTTQEIESASGLKQRVRIILKIYARVPQKVLIRHREKKRYERLLNGAPMVLTD